MKRLTKILSLIFACIIINKPSFSQQLASNNASEKQIVYLFNSYSVEKNQLMQKEFKNHSKFKISYSCIPAGIVVIESSNNLSEQDIELIKQKTNNIDAAYTILQNMTLKAIESKCATYRTN